MKSQAKLVVVTKTHRVIDITALLREDIVKRDWDAVHVDGDKGEVVELGYVRRRVWR